MLLFDQKFFFFSLASFWSQLRLNNSVWCTYSVKTLTSVVKCCIKMLSATMVLFARMTFKSTAAAAVFGCCWFEFRVTLPGMGGTATVEAKQAAVLPSIELTIENSIKFSFNSPLAWTVFTLGFTLICGTATALLFAIAVAAAAVDVFPLRWIVAISGWWWSSLVANFVEFVPLFVLWLLLLMLVLLLLFMVGGCDSVDCIPCSKETKEKKNKKII